MFGEFQAADQAMGMELITLPVPNLQHFFSFFNEYLASSNQNSEVLPFRSGGGIAGPPCLLGAFIRVTYGKGEETELGEARRQVPGTSGTHSIKGAGHMIGLVILLPLCIGRLFGSFGYGGQAGFRVSSASGGADSCTGDPVTCSSMALARRTSSHRRRATQVSPLLHFCTYIHILFQPRRTS